MHNTRDMKEETNAVFICFSMSTLKNDWQKVFTIWHVCSLDLLLFGYTFKQTSFKAADLQMLKKKLTVNTGQVMFSGEIYYYWPINSVDKSFEKHRFSLHNLIMYSRNIPMAEKRIVWFQSKKVWKYVGYFDFY